MDVKPTLLITISLISGSVSLASDNQDEKKHNVSPHKSKEIDREKEKLTFEEFIKESKVPNKKENLSLKILKEKIKNIIYSLTDLHNILNHNTSSIDLKNEDLEVPVLVDMNNINFSNINSFSEDSINEAITNTKEQIFDLKNSKEFQENKDKPIGKNFLEEALNSYNTQNQNLTDKEKDVVDVYVKTPISSDIDDTEKELIEGYDQVIEKK